MPELDNTTQTAASNEISNHKPFSSRQEVTLVQQKRVTYQRVLLKTDNTNEDFRPAELEISDEMPMRESWYHPPRRINTDEVEGVLDHASGQARNMALGKNWADPEFVQNHLIACADPDEVDSCDWDDLAMHDEMTRWNLACRGGWEHLMISPETSDTSSTDSDSHVDFDMSVFECDDDDKPKGRCTIS